MLFPLLLAAGLSAGASIYGANQASRANDKALRQQRQMYDENKALATPYIEGGNEALEAYRDAIGLNGPEKQAAYYARFENDPGWLAAQDAAVEGIERGASARSMGLSGNTLAALYDYGQRNKLGAYNSRLGQYGELIGRGQNALSLLTGANTAYGNNAATLASQGGAIRAGGALGVTDAVNQGVNNYLTYDLMNRRFAQGSGAPAVGGA